MKTLPRNTFELIQQVSGQATPSTPQAPTAPTKEQAQQLQDAARQLREAIRQNVNQQVNQELINERANAAAEKALRNQGFTIQTPQGRTTIYRRGASDAGIPPEAVDISIAFFFTVAAIVILLPLARAFARRMDRRAAPSQVPPEVSAQLDHLNRAVDAIALEVERISEGQRFTTRLLTDQREVPPPLTTGANR